MSLDRFQLYSADRSFIRQGTGTSFSYPFPADLIRGNISQPELEAVKSYLTVARTLAKETRLEAWKRASEMHSIMSNVRYESYLSLLLSGICYVVIFLVTAGLSYQLFKLHSRISILEGHDPRVATPRPPPWPRREICRFANKRRRTKPLFAPVATPEETPLTTTPPPPPPPRRYTPFCQLQLPRATPLRLLPSLSLTERQLPVFPAPTPPLRPVTSPSATRNHDGRTPPQYTLALLNSCTKHDFLLIRHCQITPLPFCKTAIDLAIEIQQHQSERLRGNSVKLRFGSLDLI